MSGDNTDRRNGRDNDRQDINVNVNTNEDRPPDEPTPEERASFITAQLIWIIAVVLVIALILFLVFSGVINLGGGDNGVLESTASP